MSAAEDRHSSADVAHEAEDVRANLAHTLDQLRDNLKPKHVVEEVVGNARIGANTLAEGLYRIARENPIPAFLIGIGAAMIIGVGGHARGRLGTSALPSGSLRERFASGPSPRRPGEANLTRSSVDRTDSFPVSTQMSERVRTTMKYPASSTSTRLPPPVEPSRLSGILDDQPLIIAALGVAVGAAIGAALPTTRMEDSWIGGASASVRHSARDMAQDEIDGMADVAGRTAQTMKQTAVDHGLSSQNVDGLVRDVGERAKSAIHEFGTPRTEKQPG